MLLSYEMLERNRRVKRGKFVAVICRRKVITVKLRLTAILFRRPRIMFATGSPRSSFRVSKDSSSLSSRNTYRRWNDASYREIISRAKIF